MITISLRREAGNTIELAVRDNGVGLPAGFDPRKTNSLGLKIVTLLAEDQLGGSFKIDPAGEAGFVIRFKSD